MKPDDEAQRPGSVQRNRSGTADLAGGQPGAADHGLEPASGVAAREHDGAPDRTRLAIPAPTPQTPLIEFLPPLEGLEPDRAQRDEQRPEVIIGRHGKPVKKRDLRKRTGRKRPKFVGTGRPTGKANFEPTDQQRMLVKAMVGMFVPKKVIAQMIGEKGISENTLQKYFAYELKNGVEHVRANLKAMALKSAQEGSVRAQTYLLDRLGGPEFAPPRRNDDVVAPLTINAAASSVSVYLPDNGRKGNE